MSKAIPKVQTPVADGRQTCSHPEGGGEGCEGFSGDSGVGEPDSEPPAIHSDGGKTQTEGVKVLPEGGKAPPDAKEKSPSQEGSTAENGPQKTVEADKQGRPGTLSPPCPAVASDQEASAMTDSSEGGGAPSRDSGISHMNVASNGELEDESARRRSLMIDTCTQTDHDLGCQAEREKAVGRTVESSSDKGENARESDLGISAVCVCTDANDNKEGKTHCDVCGLYSRTRQETSDSLGARQEETSNSALQNRQSRCTSDYSSISSSDSPRASDSSNRTCDSSNSPGSSTGSSGKGGGSNRRTGHRKVVTSGDLSPIASCGGESAVNVGLSVNTGLTPEDASKDVGSRSPCTPTSGCLKGATRNTSGAHVQFETPCDEDGHMLQDTYVTSDGHVELQRPNGGSGGSGTPTHADPLARLWSKLIPDSSPSDAASSFTVPKKWRRRHISSSSSISLGSSSSASSSDGATEFERRAPDGGWGWVIVAASFMVHCIADGVTMSFGVLFVELLSYFQEGKSLTSWVGSLFMAIPLLAGPLASILTDRYGCRTVTICGAVVACFGFFISAFVNTIPLLLLTVGVITGLGLAVCYVAAIVIVAFYFEKKRSLATGIAVAGSGIGTFLFAPLIQYLVDYWGWRLCFVLLAGIFLNMVVCGALMRDLKWTPKQSNRSGIASGTAASSRKDSTSQSSDTVGMRGGGSVGATLPSLDELRRLVQSGDVAALLSPDDAPSETLRGSASLVLLPTFLSKSQVLPPDVVPFLSSRTNAYEVVSQMYPHLLSHSLSGHVNQADEKAAKLIGLTRNEIAEFAGVFPDGQGLPSSTQQLMAPDNSCDTDSTTPGSAVGDMGSVNGRRWKKVDLELGCPDDDDEDGDADNEEEAEEAREITAMLGPRTRGPRQPGARRISTGCMGGASSPPPPAAPLRNMRINRQSMTYRGAMLNIHRYRLRASSCPDIYRNSIITIAKSQDESVWTYFDDLGEMITSCVDYSYCLNAAYLIFAVSNFVLYVFYDTVYMYLTDYAQGVGVSADDSANLISAIGILNCVGMVVMGYVGDRPWSSPMLIYNISMVLCGLSVIVMPFITDYWLLAMAAAVFGLFISANYALTSVILVELISLESFSKAYGLLLLIQGVANLIGPPLVGFIADTTGDYTMPFVISGIFIIHCGLILNLIPLIQRCKGNYRSSSTPSPADTPKNVSPTSTPNHTFKKKPAPVQV